MSDPYERVKGGKLTFKGGGGLAARKSTDMKHKKKKKKIKPSDDAQEEEGEQAQAPQEDLADGGGEAAGGVDIYTIDAAKRMKYDELFPVEAKRFGYEPKLKAKSVEEALDDRVKKKADRYCK
ncbi:hypothetical protein AAC387_Pa04g2150 [Persea americana]